VDVVRAGLDKGRAEADLVADKDRAGPKRVVATAGAAVVEILAVVGGLNNDP
jgi:hypothetical protein